MQNFLQPGKILDLASPYDRLSGQGALIGNQFGVAAHDVLNTVVGQFYTEGVFSLTKTSAQQWTKGDLIFWDDANKRCDNTNVGKLVGVASADAANPSATGNVRLVDATPQTASTIAALVDNSGGGAADGTIGVVTLPDLSAWNGGTDPTAAQATAIRAALTALTDAVTEITTKVNEYRTKLRAVGIVA